LGKVDGVLMRGRPRRAKELYREMMTLIKGWVIV
jgi:pentatricopeptide repeat protein